MLDNLQEDIDDNPSSNGSKTDHVPHLLSPYYNPGQQCIERIEEVQQHQQQHHQEQQPKVHEILLRNWKFKIASRASNIVDYLFSALYFFYPKQRTINAL